MCLESDQGPDPVFPIRSDPNPGNLHPDRNPGTCRDATKKVPPLMARPLRGGGVKAGPLRKNFFFKEVSMPIKLTGRDGKALMAWSLVEELFCGFP